MRAVDEARVDLAEQLVADDDVDDARGGDDGDRDGGGREQRDAHPEAHRPWARAAEDGPEDPSHTPH